ncbi:ABC transporter substrate-binding protein [Marinomonas ostreistagni]|uniref:ABC transporter substrate-binding protein n=1 Tax=Marinomonas ostreistagni TaxID=359209 RepID=UPI00194E203C|nr:ABC transporter substrate-binding protein [Marinomonas ostreistagni]MBM6551880.1 ABC transporter substrate-binding protein [Marinomonas ostreistagni]
MNVKHLLAVGASVMAATSFASERIVSYDLGSVDTLRALQAKNQLVGLPKQSLPTYLSEFSSAEYADVGGLKAPDAAAVAATEPTAILITGRQGEQGQALSSVAQTHTIELSGDTYWQGFSAQVEDLAELVDQEAVAEQALKALQQHLASLKQKVEGGEVLMVTHNAGGFSAGQAPIATELLGLNMVELPDTVKPVQRGTRTFMPLEVSDIVTANPEVVYVVDRSQAIGQEDQALDVAQLQQQLKEQGARTQVSYLTPSLWYLSGNGLESVRLQAEELAYPF